MERGHEYRMKPLGVGYYARTLIGVVMLAAGATALLVGLFRTRPSVCALIVVGSLVALIGRAPDRASSVDRAPGGLPGVRGKAFKRGSHSVAADFLGQRPANVS